MPIYKYECTECGHTFEDLASFSDPDPEACPSCQADAVKKLITGGNFVLKGSGWYVTDYASSSSGDAPSSNSAGSAGAPASDAVETGDTSAPASSKAAEAAAPGDASSASTSKPDGPAAA